MKTMSFSWLMVVALASFHLQAQECPLPSLPQLRAATYAVAGLTVGLPPAWTPVAQEFSTGVHVADGNTGCRLELSRVSDMSATDVVSLHERLYWGANQLSGACLASLATRLSSPGMQAYPGQYEPRLFGYKLLVLVRPVSEGRLELVTLRCPRAKAGWLAWSWLAAIADSLQWTAPKN